MSAINPETGESNPAEDDDEVSLLDLLQVVVEHLRLLIIAPLVCGLVALAISFVITPTFTASTKFMPPLQQQGGAAAMLQNLGALGGLAGAATGIKNPNDQFVAFLASESIANALISRFRLQERYDAKYKFDARKSLIKLSKINSGKDGLISVDVDDHDPVFAAQLANAYVEELGFLLQRLAITEAQQRRVFFEKQLLQTKDKLVGAEQALRASGVNSSVLRQIPEASIRVVAELQARITAHEIRIASMRGYLTDTAPEFKQALTELGVFRDQLAKAELGAAPAPLGTNDANYVARYRDMKYFETLFDLFARQFELAKSDEAREGTVIQVVDIALPPELKSKPKRAIVAILTTLAVGIALLLFVLLRHSMVAGLATPESAQKVARLRKSWAGVLGRA